MKSELFLPWELTQEEIQFMNQMHVVYADIAQFSQWAEKKNVPLSVSSCCEFLSEAIDEINDLFEGSSDDILVVSSQFSALVDGMRRDDEFCKSIDCGVNNAIKVSKEIPKRKAFDRIDTFMKIPWFGVYSGIGIKASHDIFNQLEWNRGWSITPAIESLVLWLISEIYNPSNINGVFGSEETDFWKKYEKILTAFVTRKFYGHIDKIFCYDDTRATAFLLNWYNHIGTRVLEENDTKKFEALKELK